MTDMPKDEHIRRVLYFSTHMVFFDDSDSYIERTIRCVETFVKNNENIKLDGICIYTGYTERIMDVCPKDANVYGYVSDGTDSVINDEEEDSLLRDFFTPGYIKGCVFFYDRPKFGEIMEKIETLRALEYCVMCLSAMDIDVYIDEDSGKKIAYISIDCESG